MKAKTLIKALGGSISSGYAGRVNMGEVHAMKAAGGKAEMKSSISRKSKKAGHQRVGEGEAEWWGAQNRRGRVNYERIQGGRGQSGGRGQWVW